MGSGSFLLTRHASNLFELENLNIFKTFSDKEDCIHKIRYYLTNDDEREVCAFNGQQYVFENHNYSQIIHEIREKFK
jgi:spore maturation protein CgeB